MNHRKTKIVCTLGPATEDADMLDRLIKAGMNIARFNFSHGTHEYHGRMMDTLKERSSRSGADIALLLDTKGPEIRTGEIDGGGEIELKTGEAIVLTTEVVAGTSERLSISYERLPYDVKRGNHIYIADGRIDLEVQESVPPEIRCEVRVGGSIGERKNINVPGIRSSLPAITDKDREDIAFGVKNDIDFVAASFIRKPSDVAEIREHLETLGSDAQIIAKIEDAEGVDNIDEIIRVSDGIMVARGDLGVQLPTEQIPLVQKRIIRKANQANRAVIVATQMLDSMINYARPTRAELTDVANALFDGTDAVMLSGETASGRYPAESVETMDRIARTVESSPEYRRGLDHAREVHPHDIASAIALSACSVAESVDAAAIVCPSLRGNTPRLVSRYRPQQPIIAATTSAKVQRQLLLYWGITPVMTERAADSETMVQNAIRVAMERGMASRLDRLVSVAGVPVNSPIMMNTIRFHILGTVLAKGKSGSGGLRSGRVEKTTDPNIISNPGNDTVALVRHLDSEGARVLSQMVAAIIVEGKSTVAEGLSDDQGTQVPIVSEVANAFQNLEDGAMVTVDGREKLIYEGVMI